MTTSTQTKSNENSPDMSKYFNVTNVVLKQIVVWWVACVRATILEMIIYSSSIYYHITKLHKMRTEINLYCTFWVIVHYRTSRISLIFAYWKNFINKVCKYYSSFFEYQCKWCFINIIFLSNTACFYTLC